MTVAVIELGAPIISAGTRRRDREGGGALKEGEKEGKNEEETTLLNLWTSILNIAKNTDNYNSELTYGLYQIKIELNTSHKDELTGETRYDYPDLQGNIQSLAKRVKDYYNKEIVPILYK